MIFIGIDPDIGFNGVGIWNQGTKILTPTKMKFWDLVSYLKELKDSEEPFKVVLEAGWKNKKSNYQDALKDPKTMKNLLKQYKTMAAAIKIAHKINEKRAHDVGRNHQRGLEIEELCQVHKFDYELSIPRTAKWTPAYFYMITKIKCKNPDIIDACSKVYGK